MTDIEKEREAFEAWYVRDVIDPNAKKSLTEKRGDGNYASIGAYHAFQAWLARAKPERAVSVGELGALCDEWEAQVRCAYYTEAKPLLEDLRALIAKAGVGDE